MFGHIQSLAREPVGLCKAENHHPTKGPKPQQMKIGKIADQPHCRAVRVCKDIANSIEFIAFSFNFNKVRIKLQAFSRPYILCL